MISYKVNAQISLITFFIVSSMAYIKNTFQLKELVCSKNGIRPSITPALKNNIKERNRLERLVKKRPLTYIETYRKYRNKLTSTLREAKN